MTFTTYMKCLSVRQPWASWIVHGLGNGKHKDVENRGWSTDYRGPLLIHASKTVDEVAMSLLEDVPPVPYPRGAILGKVDLVDCTKKQQPGRWHEPGRVGFVMRNPLPFTSPVRYRGEPNLFDVDLGTLSADKDAWMWLLDFLPEPATAKPKEDSAGNLERMTALAARYLGVLEPFCDRVAIAGSVRRRRPRCGDIEVVAIPKTVEGPGDLFGPTRVRDPAFCGVVDGWDKVKGKPTGRYTQRMLREGVKLDLFMATPDNWGLILAIRTGSATFSHKVLARRWTSLGYHSTGGMLQKNGKALPVREERDLFKLLGLDWVPPEKREVAA